MFSVSSCQLTTDLPCLRTVQHVQEVYTHIPFLREMSWTVSSQGSIHESFWRLIWMRLLNGGNADHAISLDKQDSTSY